MEKTSCAATHTHPHETAIHLMRHLHCCMPKKSNECDTNKQIIILHTCAVHTPNILCHQPSCPYITQRLCESVWFGYCCHHNVVPNELSAATSSSHRSHNIFLSFHLTVSVRSTDESHMFLEPNNCEIEKLFRSLNRIDWMAKLLLLQCPRIPVQSNGIRQLSTIWWMVCNKNKDDTTPMCGWVGLLGARHRFYCAIECQRTTIIQPPRLHTRTRSEHIIPCCM